MASTAQREEQESCTHPSVSRLPPVLLPVGPVVVASALPAHWKRNGERAQDSWRGILAPHRSGNQKVGAKGNSGGIGGLLLSGAHNVN